MTQDWHLQFKDRERDYCTWELKRSLKPRVCCKTGEAIPMFDMAYKGSKRARLPYGMMGDQTGEHLWLSCNEYLIEKLKGNIE